MNYLLFASRQWQIATRSATLRSVAKRYDQYCPIAHALCAIGERWSLLVVRELIEGPKRYTDLSAGLPGVSTNILAARLRELEARGIVRKRKLPPPAACTVYELTEYGSELEEVVYAIARWGARTLGPPGPDDELEADWPLNAFPALFNPVAAGDMSGRYVLRIGEDVFTVSLADGRVGVELGAAEAPDLDATFDMETFFGLASGDLAPADAVEQGLVVVDGDVETLERLFEAFSYTPRLVARTATPVAG
jgi:DNA-binding HxlR family transcriptional regulator